MIALLVLFGIIIVAILVLASGGEQPQRRTPQTANQIHKQMAEKRKIKEELRSQELRRIRKVYGISPFFVCECDNTCTTCEEAEIAIARHMKEFDKELWKL